MITCFFFAKLSCCYSPNWTFALVWWLNAAMHLRAMSTVWLSSWWGCCRIIFCFIHSCIIIIIIIIIIIGFRAVPVYSPFCNGCPNIAFIIIIIIIIEWMLKVLWYPNGYHRYTVRHNRQWYTLDIAMITMVTPNHPNTLFFSIFFTLLMDKWIGILSFFLLYIYSIHSVFFFIWIDASYLGIHARQPSLPILPFIITDHYDYPTLNIQVL